MAVTLIDALKQSKEPLQKGFISDLLRFGGDVMSVVPLVDVNAMQVEGNRWQVLPSSGFRRLYGGYTESSGTTEEIQETLFLLGGDVKIDRVLNDAGNYIENPLVTQMQMKAKSVAFQFLYSLINGDNAVDPDSFEGMKKRVSNMPARMTINLSPGAGDSLKVFANAENEHLFVDALHKALRRSRGTHLIMNEDTLEGIGRLLRRLNLLDVTQDQYDREFDAFRGRPLLDIGLKSDMSTEIIASTEDPGDGGNDSTSIYVPRFDDDEGLHAIQLSGKGMDVYDPLNGAEMEAGPQLLRRIDWPVGLFNLSKFCIVRICGFKMAAA
jgi:hypothetical protein